MTPDEEAAFMTRTGTMFLRMCDGCCCNFVTENSAPTTGSPQRQGIDDFLCRKCLASSEYSEPFDPQPYRALELGEKPHPHRMVKLRDAPLGTPKLIVLARDGEKVTVQPLGSPGVERTYNVAQLRPVGLNDR